MEERLAVLGCGPSGLFAALAAVHHGWDVQIFSLKQKSKQYGAQWLHQPIPGVTEGAGEPVRYHFFGDKRGYAKKVYGNPFAPNSFGEFGTTQVAYDLRATYSKAWDILEDNITNVDLAHKGAVFNLMNNTEATMWVNTVPLNAICLHPSAHIFDFQGVWVAPRGVINDRDEGNIVYYNGDPNAEWYRSSRVFGHTTTEWPAEHGASPPQVPGLFYIRKPLSTTCTCYPRMRRVGRFGTWTKGVLSHEAYGAVDGWIYAYKAEGQKSAVH